MYSTSTYSYSTGVWKCFLNTYIHIRQEPFSDALTQNVHQLFTFYIYIKCTNKKIHIHGGHLKHLQATFLPSCPWPGHTLRQSPKIRRMSLWRPVKCPQGLPGPNEGKDRVPKKCSKVGEIRSHQDVLNLC